MLQQLRGSIRNSFQQRLLLCGKRTSPGLRRQPFQKIDNVSNGRITVCRIVGLSGNSGLRCATSAMCHNQSLAFFSQRRHPLPPVLLCICGTINSGGFNESIGYRKYAFHTIINSTDRRVCLITVRAHQVWSPTFCSHN